MKPLFILITSFILSLILIKILRHTYDLALSARIAISAMLLFTSIGHFIYTNGMVMMIPDFFPMKKALVELTGILEILLGIGILIPNTKIYCSWILIVFLLLMLPANINAALKNIDFQNATSHGKGISYLWFRIPLQLLFIVWTYLSCIKF